MKVCWLTLTGRDFAEPVKRRPDAVSEIRGAGEGPPFGEFSGEPMSCRTRESGTPTDLGEAQYRMLLRERGENAHHTRRDCSRGTVSASARHDGPPPSLRDPTRASLYASNAS